VSGKRASEGTWCLRLVGAGRYLRSLSITYDTAGLLSDLKIGERIGKLQPGRDCQLRRRYQLVRRYDVENAWLGRECGESFKGTEQRMAPIRTGQLLSKCEVKCWIRGSNTQERLNSLGRHPYQP